MITFLLVDRANYGRLKPVMHACAKAGLSVNAICGGSMVLDRFKLPVEQVEQEFTVAETVYCELEGSRPVTMAMSMGIATTGFARALSRSRPELVVMIGDRYEAQGAATAAACLGIPILHLQGGEKSGTLDDRWRNSITAMADYHWPATQLSASKIRGNILGIGCPSTDLMIGLDNTPGDYILAAYHPDTARPGHAAAEVAEVLEALKGRKAVFMWPNIDAESYAVERVLRQHPEIERRVNFEPEEYYSTLARAKCLVGNSSSFVRDSAIVGVPAIIVGSRQLGREAADNVTFVTADHQAIFNAMMAQPERYARSSLFGDGKVSERIAGAIQALTRKAAA